MRSIFSIIFVLIFSLAANAKLENYNVINEVVLESTLSNFSMENKNKLQKSSDWKQVSPTIPGKIASFQDSLSNQIKITHNGEKLTGITTSKRRGNLTHASFDKDENLKGISICNKKISTSKNKKPYRCVSLTEPVCNAIVKKSKSKKIENLILNAQQCQVLDGILEGHSKKINDSQKVEFKSVNKLYTNKQTRSLFVNQSAPKHIMLDSVKEDTPFGSHGTYLNSVLKSCKAILTANKKNLHNPFTQSFDGNWGNQKDTTPKDIPARF